MMRRSTDGILRIILVGMFVVSLCAFCGCKPSEEPQGEPDAKAPAEAEVAGAGSGAEEVAAAPKEEPKEEPKVEAKVDPIEEPNVEVKVDPVVEEVAAAAAVPAGWVPIPLELPKPMFVGTPQDTRVPNLRKPLGKARAPFSAPAGVTNVAAGKSIKSTDEEPIIGELEMITDGDKEAADGSYVELGPFVQHVTIDLEAKYNIYAIVVWHYHKQARVYFDMICQVADDADFITNVKTLYNNDLDNSAGQGIGKDEHYSETNEGELIDGKGVAAQYIRLYSNGNTSNDLNHYIEVEVFGKPAEGL